MEQNIKSVENKYKTVLNLNNLLKVRLKACEELSKIINSEKDIKEALNNTLDLVLDLFKVPSGSIMLLDRSGRFMDISVARGEKSDQMKDIKINIGEGIAGKVAQTGEPMIVNDVNSSCDFNKNIGEQIGYIPENILCVPIKIREKILGVIEIMGKFENDFTEDEKSLLFSIASTLGLSIANVRLYKIADQTVSRLRTLMEVSKIINTTMDLQELLNSIMGSSKDVLNAEGSSLMLIDEGTDELFFNVTTGAGKDKLKEIRIPVGKGIAGIVAQENKSINVEDAVNDSRIFKQADKATKVLTKNLIAVPMHVRDKVVGVLEVINAKDRQYFDEYDVDLLQSLADHAGIAVHNRDLISNLKIANQELKRSYKEIKAMYEMSEGLTNETDIERLFYISVDVIREVFEVDKVSIMLYDEESGSLKIKRAIGINDNLIDKILVSEGDRIAGHVYKNNRPVLIKNMNKEKKFGRNKKLRYRTSSFISVPLKLREKVIGVLNVTDKKDDSAFDEKDLLTFTELGNQIGKSYENIIYYNEFLEKQKFEKELEVTRNIQQHVLPKDFPEIKGLDIFATNIPAKEVGGDYYDYMMIDDKTHSFLIADVSGKSLPASMFMALSRSITRVEAYNLISPSKVLEESNKYIFKDSESGMFVTMFYFVVHSEANKIMFGSAGHNEQLLYKRAENDFKYLKVKGIPLGVSPESSYMESKQKYKAGDILILYTDGVTEAINKAGDEFGIERFKKIIVKNKDLSANDLGNKILDGVNEFTQEMPQFDDITLMVIKFT